MITKNTDFGYTIREKEDRSIKFLNVDLSYYDTAIIVDALHFHASQISEMLVEIPPRHKKFYDGICKIKALCEFANEFESFMINPYE